MNTSVVAVRADARGGHSILAIAAEAKNIIGRTPGSLRVTRPLKDWHVRAS